MTNTIEKAKRIDYAEVFPANGSWMIRFTSEPMKSKMARLFNSAEIPTAYRSTMPFSEVFKNLRAIHANRNTCFVEACR